MDWCKVLSGYKVAVFTQHLFLLHKKFPRLFNVDYMWHFFVFHHLMVKNNYIYLFQIFHTLAAQDNTLATNNSNLTEIVCLTIFTYILTFSRANSSFVCYSMQEVVGSTCIFIALHRSMLRLKRLVVYMCSVYYSGLSTALTFVMVIPMPYTSVVEQFHHHDNHVLFVSIFRCSLYRE